MSAKSNVGKLEGQFLSFSKGTVDLAGLKWAAKAGTGFTTEAKRDPMERV